MSEKNIPKPKSYYAFTKYKSEEIIKKYGKKFNFKYGILRYFNVAGASPSGKIGEIEKSYGHLIKNLAIQSTKLRPLIYLVIITTQKMALVLETTFMCLI